jgi:hypothetical protein
VIYRQLLSAFPDLAQCGPTKSKPRHSPAARKAMSEGMRRYWRRRHNQEHARRQTA